MTDDTAARLRALASAASIGPWSVHGNNCDEWYVYALHARYETLPGNPSPVKVAWVPWSPGTLRHEHDAAYIAAASPDVVLRLLDALDEARRERDEQKRVIDDAYAALGPDAWWMDPPDGGSPTLAEMVAKANEDGRALYSVKRERDAAMALLKKHGIDYEP